MDLTSKFRLEGPFLAKNFGRHFVVNIFLVNAFW